MLSLDTALTFTATMAALAFFPGPGAVALVARVLGSGFWSALPLIAAMIVGEITFLAMTVLGLALLAETLGTLFNLVKYAGAAYLFYLGWRYWTASDSGQAITAKPAESPRAMFFSGLALTLGNPKVVIFYLALLPSVIDLKHLTYIEFTQMMLIVVALLIVALACYALAADRARRLLIRSANIRRLNRGVGTVLFAAAAAVAAT